MGGPEAGGGGGEGPGRAEAPWTGPCVVMYGRYPQRGKVKTRLAQGLGADAAVRLYELSLAGVVRQVAPVACRATLHCADPADVKACQRWLRDQGLHDLPAATPNTAGTAGAGGGLNGGLGGDPATTTGAVAVRAQRADVDDAQGLGARLAASFEEEFGRGADRVLVVGTDVPHLSTGVMIAALHLLRRHDMVVGPAVDGGYYLIGLARKARKQLGDLFYDIGWSTEHVLQEQLENAALLGLAVAPLQSLPKLIDVDTAEDLEQWVEEDRKSAVKVNERFSAAAEDLVAKPPGGGEAAQLDERRGSSGSFLMGKMAELQEKLVETFSPPHKAKPEAP